MALGLPVDGTVQIRQRHVAFARPARPLVKQRAAAPPAEAARRPGVGDEAHQVLLAGGDHDPVIGKAGEGHERRAVGTATVVAVAV